MSQQKIKTESYQNIGGINQKVSPHDTGIFEFLDLSNLDFQTPGSLSQRWGSTQYIGQTFPGPVRSIFEFARLDGTSMVVQSFSGGIFYGATTGQGQGMSFTLQSVTLSLFSFVSSYSHAPITLVAAETGPQSALYFGDPATPIGAPTAAIFNIASAAPSNGFEAFTVLNNYMFGADGSKFFKFDGSTTTPVGLPPPLRAYDGLGVTGTGASVYYSNISGASDFIGLGMTGGHAIYASYVNNRGFEGPLWPISWFAGASFMNGTSFGGLGGTFLVSRIPLATPLQYGISAINQYIYWGPSLVTADFLGTQFWSGFGGAMRLVSQTPASGSTLTYIMLGSTIGGQSFIQANAGAFPPTNAYQPLGITLQQTLPYQNVSEIDLVSYDPTMLETYQNRLISAGYSQNRSTVWFSDIAEPEGYNADFNFEVRTNDGDFITALKAYSTRLYIFKQRSFHILVGDNPADFDVNQVTDQYGCINNRCVVNYDDYLVFLDRRGVIEWNGAQISPISDAKVKPIFDRMNYAAALTEACMVHDKLRSQILIAIPVDGSTTNNIMVVYDYLVGAWTSYKNFSASALAQVAGRNSTKNAFYGDYLGRLNWFGSSFGTDNGATIIPYWKTRFLHDLGDSTTKTYRRLFLDTDPPGTSTNAFRVDFYQNYGTSIVASSTITLTGSQSRIDFGIQNCKSLAFELTGLQVALPLRIHGFTLESRFMRRV
jgi:hypothetical protein